MSRANLQDWGQYRHCVTELDQRFWTCTQTQFFYVRVQFVAECRCVRNITLAAVWKYFKLESKSSPTAIQIWKKAMDDVEVPSVGCAGCTQSLLSQRSITDSPDNARKVVGPCCNTTCRIRKSHMKIYALFQQNKKYIYIKEQLGSVFYLFFS